MDDTQVDYSKEDRIILKVTSWLAGIVFIILLVAGIISLINYFKYEETNDAQIQAYINPIVSRVNGYVISIRYEENQQVKKGDTLVIIEQSQYTLKKQESEADVINVNAQIRALESSIKTTSQVALVSKEQIAAAKARLIREQQDYERYEKLFNEESATRQQLENVKAALDIALSGYQSATADYKAALSKVDDIKAQRDVLLAEIRRRKAQEGNARLDLSYTVITAPYNGKMGRKTIQDGQFIQINQTLAFIVNEDAGKWVIANFKETQIRHMHIGEQAEIEADAFPGEVYHGKILSISPATGSSFSVLPPDNSTGNFVKIVQRIPVKILFSDTGASIKHLASGMNAFVRIKK